MNTVRSLPFHVPYHSSTEVERLQEALADSHLSGNGPFTKKVEALLEKELGAERVLMTTSCTHALELAAMLLDIVPGDEVIVPSFTFVSTINAFVLRGAKPVFVDIREKDLNLDPALVAAAYTDRTRAVLPVHYGGAPCAMDELVEQADRHGATIVEDAAHAMFTDYQGKSLGSFGRLATFSFHATKNFSCGEGGALQINDPALVERAEIIREKGTDRSLFLRGEVDKYTWRDIGSSYVISDLLCALLYSQLEARQTIQQRRGELWHAYRRELAGWANQNQVTLPPLPAHDPAAYHLFYILMPTAEAAGRLLEASRQQKVGLASHYRPLHLSDMGRTWGYHAGDCPITESVVDRLVRLPLYPDVDEPARNRVLELVTGCTP